MRNRQNGRILKSTTTTFEIIDALIELEGARVTEIADHLEISKSTACNHLHTLQEAEYVILQGDEYHPSLKFTYVSEHAMRRDPTLMIAIEVMRDLTKEVPFETGFTIEENGVGRYLTPEVNQPRKYDKFAFIGQKEYLHTTAAGKAILAGYPDKQIEKIINHWGLPAKTTQTISIKDELFTELEQVREQGYAINHGENRERIYAVGQAVRKQDGTIFGAISIGSQVDRIRKEEFTSRINTLLDKYVEQLEHRINDSV